MKRILTSLEISAFIVGLFIATGVAQTLLNAANDLSNILGLFMSLALIAASTSILLWRFPKWLKSFCCC
jgi:hypothetical protein